MKDYPTHNKIDVKNFKHEALSVDFIGPDLGFGALPALFYFALSAHESLSVDPYNQPVVYLSSFPLRIFSFDLPGHGVHLSSQEALRTWAEAFERKDNILDPFVHQVTDLIHALEEKLIIAKGKCAAMGLSRGAFIATHVAAKCSPIRAIVGFAPLTKLAFAKELQSCSQMQLLEEMDIAHSIPFLLDRSVRFYIGNCDKRVDTRSCFAFIEKLATEMDAMHIRPAQAELIITPSIGFQGHGTSPHTFHDGAEWIAQQLGVLHAH